MAKSTAVLKYSSTKAKAALVVCQLPISRSFTTLSLPLFNTQPFFSKLQGQDLSQCKMMQPHVIFTKSTVQKRRDISISQPSPCSTLSCCGCPAPSDTHQPHVTGVRFIEFGIGLLGWEWKFCSSRGNFPKQNTFSN